MISKSSTPQSENSPVVTLDGVSRRFGSQTALDNVSLSIPRGVVFALLGENGAGKSTSLKIMLGLERCDSGSVNVMGMNSRTDGIAIRSGVGYVPESPALYDWMTVREIGWFTAGFYGVGFQAQYEKLANEYELPLDRKIKNLSKGGRAKVSLALASADEPALMIMDEPTSGLDTLVRRKFMESMIDVAASGRTVLLSSHQIPEVERVADYVAVLHEGKLLECDKLENLKESIEQWVVTTSDANAELPELKSNVLLHEGQKSRRQRLLVRDTTPDCLWKLRDAANVEEVQVHTPSLEEIFVGLIQSKSAENSANNSVERSAEVS